MYNAFVEDWCDRYSHDTCTLEHLDRLLKIGRLTEDEYNYIIQQKEGK